MYLMNVADNALYPYSGVKPRLDYSRNMAGVLSEAGTAYPARSPRVSPVFGGWDPGYSSF